MKVIASLLISLCFCLPGWAAKKVTHTDDIEQAVQNVMKDIEIQIPELLKGMRITLQMSEFQVQIPEIKIHLPELQLPEIRFDVPVSIQIPAITLPEIHVEVPKIDIQIPKSLE
jgi:hypothetical protein